MESPVNYILCCKFTVSSPKPVFLWDYLFFVVLKWLFDNDDFFFSEHRVEVRLFFVVHTLIVLSISLCGFGKTKSLPSNLFTGPICHRQTLWGCHLCCSRKLATQKLKRHLTLMCCLCYVVLVCDLFKVDLH